MTGFCGLMGSESDRAEQRARDTANAGPSKSCRESGGQMQHSRDGMLRDRRAALTGRRNRVATVDGGVDEMTRIRLFLLMAVVIAAWPRLASAQFETSAVVGSVRDKTRRRRSPGAKVTLTNVGTGVLGNEHDRYDGQLRVLHGPDRHLPGDRGEDGLLDRARRQRARWRSAARQRVDMTLEIGQVDGEGRSDGRGGAGSTPTPASAAPGASPRAAAGPADASIVSTRRWPS